ncbi:hypothetical protein ACT1UG_27095 [Bacillus paramycoides]|uniref:hypothetical protein n=1 Tax=Bacillus paramycoides TaxID=2026194 RepID=UPI0040592FD1
MKINYGIFEVEGHKKRPIINFEDKEFIALEDLLNVDYSLIGIDDILEKINNVEEGKSDYEEIGNERSLLEIERGQCTVSDMFEGLIEEDELYPTVRISILELKNIILKWKQEREKLLQIINE